LDIYGEVVISMGSVPQGQGHETTAAQVVADVLGVTPGHVKVKPGFDTEQNAYTGHTGTYASSVCGHGTSGHSRRGHQTVKEMSATGGVGAEGQRKDWNLVLAPGTGGPR
jgi:2-furoyl-CoA dehydrogenase large subunit